MYPAAANCSDRYRHSMQSRSAFMQPRPGSNGAGRRRRHRVARPLRQPAPPHDSPSLRPAGRLDSKRRGALGLTRRRRALPGAIRARQRSGSPNRNNGRADRPRRPRLAPRHVGRRARRRAVVIATGYSNVPSASPVAISAAEFPEPTSSPSNASRPGQLGRILGGTLLEAGRASRAVARAVAAQ